MAMWRQQGRHKTGTTGDNSLHPSQQWMGNITEWLGFDYVEATRKAQDSIGVDISERKSGTERMKMRKKRELVFFLPPGAQLVL